MILHDYIAICLHFYDYIAIVFICIKLSPSLFPLSCACVRAQSLDERTQENMERTQKHKLNMRT